MKLISGEENGDVVKLTNNDINRIIEADIFDEDELPDEWFHNL